MILIAEPEVYRLGIDEREALEVIRNARPETCSTSPDNRACASGVIVADGDKIVFAPVSKHIEAGSETAEKPNATLLKGASATSLLRAAGVGQNECAPAGRIGKQALDTAKVEALEQELKRNSPDKFGIAARTRPS